MRFSLCNSFTGDTYLRLFDASGVNIKSNDDGCGRASVIDYTFTAACQQYTLKQGCYSSGTCSGTVTITGTSQAYTISGSYLIFGTSVSCTISCDTDTTTLDLVANSCTCKDGYDELSKNDDDEWSCTPSCDETSTTYDEDNNECICKSGYETLTLNTDANYF